MEGEAWLTEAEELLARRELVAADEAFAHASHGGADPDRCGGGRWMLAMLGGHFETAWRESDAMRARGTPDPHRFWQGERLRGKCVIVRCLHGFGDTVQMLRYAPALNRMADTVIWEVPPRMVGLARYVHGVTQVITWGDEIPAWDVQVEVMELPYLMRTRLQELPVATRYLKVSKADMAKAGAAMAKAGAAMGEKRQPRVGVVWAGGDWNASRSVPFAFVTRLLAVEGVEFWNLQGGASAGEAAESKMRNATAICGRDQAALAAAIANLDLVITVDTLAAHLAGAMGKPVWVMLGAAADWRWMVGREDSPWYPSMRLFRQHRQGDWPGLIDVVATALREFTLLG